LNRLLEVFAGPDGSTGFILRGSLLSSGLRIFAVLLAYASHAIISRLLGVHGYGIYVIGLSWSLVLTLPARLGFDQSSLRYATVYLETGQTGAFRAFVRVATGGVTLASIAIGSLFAILGGSLGVGDHRVILAAALLILPQALLGVLSAIIRSSNRIWATQFYDQILRPAVLIAALLLFAATGRPLEPSAVLLFHSAAAFLALGMLVIHFFKVFGHVRRTRPNYQPLSQWLAVSMPLLVIAMAQELLNQLEIILLGYFRNAEQAALFSAAWRLAGLVTFALTTFGVLCGPMVASAYHRRDVQRLNKLVQFAARLITASAGLMILILVAGGKLLLSVFGPGFEAAYLPMLALLAGAGVNAFTGIVAYLLTMTGRERIGMWIFCGALAVSLTLNLLLIPKFGALGAAIASSTALSAWNLAMIFYVRRKLGLDATALGRAPVGTWPGAGG
jgi:O-antigen/teichoic acid export membrane protein